MMNVRDDLTYCPEKRQALSGGFTKDLDLFHLPDASQAPPRHWNILTLPVKRVSFMIAALVMRPIPLLMPGQGRMVARAAC